MWGKVLTLDELHRKLQIVKCPCLSAREQIDHYRWATQLWFFLGGPLVVQWVPAGSLGPEIVPWSGFWPRGRSRWLLQAIPLLVSWVTWRECDRPMFEGVFSGIQRVRGEL